ncbi:MAG: DUF72 domain-containing protein [Bacteroidales bacterium]
MKMFIGCSGYSYNDWNKKFYPEDLPKKDWLSFYAEHFNTVEINNTFYKFPTEDQLSQWKDETPAGFKFTIKANRYLSHMKKLKVDDDFMQSLERFNDTLESIKEKLGCVLWQLPGNLKQNIPKLETFFDKLDKSMQHVIEFREKSWFNDPVYQVLRKHGIAYCILSAPDDLPEDVVTTSNTAYLRFHGKSTWYNYEYSDDELLSWKNRVNKLKGIDQIFIYFNNDHQAYAVKNAMALKEMMNK